MNPAREHFGSKFAAIMAMAGSAIGLGNIWRFPYLVGQNGGAAFILVYIVSCLILALPIFFAENIIGRRGRSSTYGAIRNLAPGSRWKWLGLVTVVTPTILLGYYSVVGGWSMDYLFKACTSAFTGDIDTGALFGSFISSTWEPLIAHTLFMAATVTIILLGVRNGIEAFTKITMPLLFVLILVIVIYGLTLPGSAKGVEYLVKPDFSKLNGSGVAAAMGQAFFSLSLGVGTILTYSSYMSKDDNLVSSGLSTFAADFGFAMLAGFAIMPAVFASGIQPGEGPGLVFNTLPYIFNKMGGFAPWISSATGILFFLAILTAALTSSISLLEVGVAFLTEEKGIKRTRATLLLAAITWAVGVVCSLSFGPLAGVHILGVSIFDFLDHLVSDWLMPLGGLLFTLFVSWVMSRQDVYDEVTNGGSCNTRIFNFVYELMHFVAPVGIIIVFLTNLLG